MIKYFGAHGPPTLSSHACRACGARALENTLDLGPQALTNRFLSSPSEKEFTYHATLSVCGSCSTVQLPTPPSIDEIRSRFAWITYNEPEGHLDRLVERLAALPGLSPTSVIGGLTFKDDSTLERFRKKGFSKTWRLDAAADLGVGELNAGLETIQARLTVDGAKKLAAKHGKADLLLVRHILEHVHTIAPFVAALKELITPTGVVVFEAPESGQALHSHNYGMFWEEHVQYFTAATFQANLQRWGFNIAFFESYPYALENSLVAAVRPGSDVSAAAPNERALFKSYADGLAPMRANIRAALEKVKAGRKCALLGAGHVSATYINIFGLVDLIDFVVDDNPNKKGLFMPGSKLPIRGSEHLLTDGIQLCLLGLSPESEQKVIKAQSRFTGAGGVFASIFPGGERSLVAMLAR